MRRPPTYPRALIQRAEQANNRCHSDRRWWCASFWASPPDSEATPPHITRAKGRRDSSHGPFLSQSRGTVWQIGRRSISGAPPPPNQQSRTGREVCWVDSATNLNGCRPRRWESCASRTILWGSLGDRVPGRSLLSLRRVMSATSVGHVLAAKCPVLAAKCPVVKCWDKKTKQRACGHKGPIPAPGAHSASALTWFGDQDQLSHATSSRLGTSAPGPICLVDFMCYSN